MPCKETFCGNYIWNVYIYIRCDSRLKLVLWLACREKTWRHWEKLSYPAALCDCHVVLGLLEMNLLPVDTEACFAERACLYDLLPRCVCGCVCLFDLLWLWSQGYPEQCSSLPSLLLWCCSLREGLPDEWGCPEWVHLCTWSSSAAEELSSLEQDSG